MLLKSLSSNEIDITHPLPLSKSGTGKIPVIFKFIRRSARNLIYSKKTKTGLALMESLTKRRLNLVMEAKKLFNKNVWTSSGKIYCSIGQKKYEVKSMEDIKTSLQAKFSIVLLLVGSVGSYLRILSKLIYF